MSLDWYNDIKDFQEQVVREATPKVPQITNEETKKLRVELITEEVVRELIPAIEDDDIVAIADGAVDSIVVILGTCVACGIDIRPIWNEIHRTNMAKKDGPVREDGKRLKPEGWVAPDVEAELVKQGWSSDI